MKKPRILVIIPDRLSRPTGGMGIGLSHTVRVLQDTFDFDILGFPDVPDVVNYIGVSNPIPSIGDSTVVTLMGQIAYLYAAVSRPKPDCVHAYDWSTYLAGAYVADFFKVPLVVTMQLSVALLAQRGVTYVRDTSTRDGALLQDTLQKIELHGLNKAQCIIQISKAYASYFNALPELQHKTVVIPHGVDVSEWGCVTQVPLMPGNARYKIIYLGRFAPMKGIRALCAAHIPSEIDLIFVGEPSYGEPAIVELIRHKVATTSNVHMLPAVYGQDKVNLLRASHAVIMPSVHEPFGIVALEALAAQTVLLSSRIDGLSDFLDESNSLYCGHTPQHIEASLQQFLKMSEIEKQRLIAAGLETARAYDWSIITKQIAGTYIDVIKKFNANF